MNKISIETSDGLVQLPDHISLDEETKKEFKRKNEESFWNNPVYMEVLRKLAKE